MNIPQGSVPRRRVLCSHDRELSELLSVSSMGGGFGIEEVLVYQRRGHHCFDTMGLMQGSIIAFADPGVDRREKGLLS